MQIVKQSFEILDAPDAEELLRKLELYGRVCYKSEGRITPDSSRAFIKRLLDSQHESVIEHATITVRFITDRGVTHELVRHRLISCSQESTRYCNYKTKGLAFIAPEGATTSAFERWLEAVGAAECAYLEMINDGASPQIARSVLPTSLKTELIVTANLREWRHILKLRTSKAAHPQMRALMIPLLAKLHVSYHEFFGDIGGSLPSSVAA